MRMNRIKMKPLIKDRIVIFKVNDFSLFYFFVVLKTKLKFCTGIRITKIVFITDSGFSKKDTDFVSKTLTREPVVFVERPVFTLS